MYTTLTLDQVYLAIGYYLRHRESVDAYVRRTDQEAERLRQEWEAEHPLYCNLLNHSLHAQRSAI